MLDVPSGGGMSVGVQQRRPPPACRAAGKLPLAAFPRLPLAGIDARRGRRGRRAVRRAWQTGGMTHAGRPPHVAIVGGGIAGLAAAYFLRDAPVTVTVDEGAEALLARRPEGTDLIRAVGLADQLVSPGTTSARIWTRGVLRELPGRQLMGVPSDFAELARSGVLSGAGLARARLDAELPPTPLDGDVPVA